MAARGPIRSHCAVLTLTSLTGGVALKKTRPFGNWTRWSAGLSAGDVMARSYPGLVNMATRFGFRLAKAREGSQHLGMPVRYLLEDKNGVLSFRSLEDVERKLSAMAQER